MRRDLFFLVVVAVSIVATGGCRSTKPSADTRYETVANDLRRDTDFARIQNAQAIELIDRGEWAKAEKTLLAALDADVTFGPAHNNLGRVYYEQGKYYLAAWEFQYAIKLMPYQPQPRNNLGLVLEATGKLDDAVKHYDEALAIEPDNPELLGNCARARVRRGDRDAAVNELLATIVAHDTRPEWIRWAQERLILQPPPSRAMPATQPAP